MQAPRRPYLLAMSGFSQNRGLVQCNRDQSLSVSQNLGCIRQASPTSMYLTATIPSIYNASTPYSSVPSDYNSTLSTYYPTQLSSNSNRPLRNGSTSDIFDYSQASSPDLDIPTPPIDFDSDIYEIFIKTTKKYKPVALKIKPVGSDLPTHFRIIRNIVGDPLADLPTLNPNPPPFTPTGRYTQERKDLFDKNNEEFLLPAERDLMHHFMMLHQDGFAWTDSE